MPPETLGQRLLAARRRAVLSQRELAQRAGLNARVIVDLERDRRAHPFPSTLRALAAALGMPVQELAGVPEAIPPPALAPAPVAPPDDVTTGTRLRRQRLAAGLSQAALARAAGVTSTTVCRLERGRHRPSMVTLEKLARALGRSVAELLSGGSTEP